MGYGGFYVVFFVMFQEYKCFMFGCIIGMSIDVMGKLCL